VPSSSSVPWTPCMPTTLGAAADRVPQARCHPVAMAVARVDVRRAVRRSP